MTATEWLLYNILELKFIQGKKVRDVAMRLSMSESDLYRKQRIAIEKVAHNIAEMERLAREQAASHEAASVTNAGSTATSLGTGEHAAEQQSLLDRH